MQDSVIHSYSQQQAVEDGILANLSEHPLVKEAGFKIPLHVTSGVYSYLEVPEAVKGIQDFNGRLWDVLSMAKMEFQRMKAEEDYLGTFEVIFQENIAKMETVKMYLSFDQHEGFTIMLPDEY